MKTAVIFDLDQTLADSRHLAEYRENGDWATVMRQAGEVRLYEGVRELWDGVRAFGYRIAIATTSPRQYCELICNAQNIQPDVMVCFHDVEHQKPAADAYVLATQGLFGQIQPNHRHDISALRREITKQKLHYNVVSAGDSWKDTWGSHKSSIHSVGCLWGADDRRSLILSEPTYIAQSPQDLLTILARLKTNRYPTIYDLETQQEAMYREGLWLHSVSGQPHGRMWLDAQRRFSYVHLRYRGLGFTSNGNAWIDEFKIKPELTQLRFLKEKAAARFATDLAAVLPMSASVMFIPTSKMPTDAAYDDRFDLTRVKLSELRRDITILQNIQVLVSREPVHESEDTQDRRPEAHLARWAWQGGALTGGPVFIIDDVLTSGGSFEAVARMIEQNSPGVEVWGLFWALSTG